MGHYRTLTEVHTCALALQEANITVFFKAVNILFFFFFYKQGGSQGLIICRHTICRKQSPICCWLFTAPHEDAAGHKPVQFSFSRQRRVAWYSFPNPMERAKQNISFPQNTLNSWILLPDKSCLSNICCSNFSRES